MQIASLLAAEIKGRELPPVESMKDEDLKKRAEAVAASVVNVLKVASAECTACLLYTSPSPRD